MSQSFTQEPTTPRSAVFSEKLEMDKTPSSPLSKKSPSRLAPLLSGLRLTPRNKTEAAPFAPSPLSPSSPKSSGFPRRPHLTRHLRSKSSSLVPTQLSTPPMLRSISHPSPLNPMPSSPRSPLYRQERMPSSPRTHTPSPPPSLVWDTHPSLTPVRSRSPSVSSLDTIEDIPEAESAAELEPIPEVPKPVEIFGRFTIPGPVSPSGGMGMSRHRKRWSVCGGEKRADLNLETIWEDVPEFGRGRGAPNTGRRVGGVWVVDGNEE